MKKITGRIGAFLKNTPKKYLIIASLVLLGLGWFFLSPKKGKEEMKFAPATKSNIQATVAASGTLTGSKVADLNFKSAGKLRYLGFAPGDMVKKGQLIGSLDNTDLAVALQQAENNLRDKQAIVDAMHESLKGHESDETLSQRQARTTAEVAKDNAFDAVRAAKNALSNANIYSPISGIVTKQDSMQVGQNVSPSNLVAQIVDFSQFIFEVEVDESDISRITIAQKATVSLNSYQDKTFSGRVAEIAPIAQTSSNGATTVIIKILLDSTDIAQIAQLNGQAEIIVSEKENVLTVPQEAIVDEKFVYVRSNGKPEKREVQTGIYSDSRIEILSGLSENEEVLQNPSSLTVNKLPAK